METKDKTDYAAAYRQYCMYGRGRTLKQFCSDEDFNYTKFRRYVDKALWSASKAERDSFGNQFAPLQSDGTPEGYHGKSNIYRILHMFNVELEYPTMVRSKQPGVGVIMRNL